MGGWWWWAVVVLGGGGRRWWAVMVDGGDGRWRRAHGCGGRAVGKGGARACDSSRTTSSDERTARTSSSSLAWPGSPNAMRKRVPAGSGRARASAMAARTP
eukprot:1967434-Prymnesium_polylepis.1